MPYVLNNREVPEGLYNRARAVINNGGKVFLLTPGAEDYYGDYQKLIDATPAGQKPCVNCDGIGKLGLQIIVGGPYDSPDNKKHIIWHEGKWYVQETVLFPCPICHGSGSAPAGRARSGPVVF